jgi:hypothetical protein
MLIDDMPYIDRDPWEPRSHLYDCMVCGFMTESKPLFQDHVITMHLKEQRSRAKDLLAELDRDEAAGKLPPADPDGSICMDVV